MEPNAMQFGMICITPPPGSCTRTTPYTIDGEHKPRAHPYRPLLGRGLSPNPPTNRRSLAWCPPYLLRPPDPIECEGPPAGVAVAGSTVVEAHLSHRGGPR